MNEPQWIAYQVLLAIHEAQLAEHGGSPGLRDNASLQSALARPQQLYTYLHDVTLNQLAAAYAFGVAKNHAFVDGNKRTAWVCCAIFLELNGVAVVSKPEEVVQMVLQSASSLITEEDFTAWLNKDHPRGI